MEGVLGTGRDVLVARDRALADLDVVIGRSAGALLTGEAGIGKSHLARAYAERLRRRGLAIGQVTALTALSATPLAALRPLVGAGPTALRDPVSWAADRLTDEHPAGVVLVDDVDALDDLSAAVLHRLAHTAHSRRPPRLVLTLRGGQSLPDPVERLLTQGSVEQLRIGPLLEEGVATLVGHLLSGPVHPTAVQELTARSGGNPLFVREIVLAAWEQGSWIRREHGWHLAGPVGMPDRIQPLVDARVNALPEQARRLAELLAVAGPLPFDLLVHIDLIGAVGQLEAAGIGRVGEAEVALAHPLFGDALYRRTDGATRAVWTQQLLDAAARMSLPPGPTVRLASLALNQGQWIDATRLVTAAQMALSLFDLPTARDLADAAIEAGDRGRAPLLAAQARTLLGDPAGEAALIELSTSSDARVGVEARLVRARLVIGGENGATSALELLDAAPASARRDTMRAVALMRLNHWQDATVAADSALSQATDSVEWVDAAGIAALLHTWGGDPALAVALAGRGLARIDEGALCGPHGSVVLAQSGCVAALLHGDADLADRFADDTGRASDSSPYFAAHRGLRAGVLAVYRGHSSAVRPLTTATAMLVEGDPVELRSWAFAFLSRALVRLGKVNEADAAVRRGRELALPGQVAPKVELLVAEAWLAAARGEPARACEMLAALSDDQAEVPGSAALVAVDLARLGDLDGGGSRLSETAARAGGTVLATALGLLEAASRRDVAQVCAAALNLQDLGMHIWAADLLAVIARTVSGTDRELLEARARAAASACGGPGTPALVGTPSHLTPTQQRVAELAARGLTNRQAGESLDISPRTAATHLHRAYRVLNVHDRDELARLLPGTG